MPTATILPFHQRPTPGIKRALRPSPRQLHDLSRALDQIAAGCAFVLENRGCTGCSELEDRAFDLAIPTGRLAEILSLECVERAEGELLARESA